MASLNQALQKIVTSAFDFLPQPIPNSERIQNAKIVAHRGNWNLTDRKENTLAAFDRCLAHNVWAIEFDIRWSKDNQPVIHHDANTQRIFGKNRVLEELTLEQLQREFPQIPTLPTMVARYARKLHLMIEIKGVLTKQRLAALQKELRDLAPIDDFHLMSLKPAMFDLLSFVDPKALVAIAQWNINSVVKAAVEKKLGAMTGQYLILNNKIQQYCHCHGLKVGTGFIDSENLFYRELNRNMDWIFTNTPDLLYKLQAMRSSASTSSAQ